MIDKLFVSDDFLRKTSVNEHFESTTPLLLKRNVEGFPPLLVLYGGSFQTPFGGVPEVFASHSREIRLCAKVQSRHYSTKKCASSVVEASTSSN